MKIQVDTPVRRYDLKMNSSAEDILYGENRPRIENMSELARLRRSGMSSFPDQLLCQAIDRLQPEYRLVLQLQEKGLSNRQIGIELGLYGRELRRVGSLCRQAQARLAGEIAALSGKAS